VWGQYQGRVVFQSKKAVDKFEGIPAMQYQDFLGPDYETGCEVVRPRGEQPPCSETTEWPHNDPRRLAYLQINRKTRPPGTPKASPAGPGPWHTKISF